MVSNGCIGRVHELAACCFVYIESEIEPQICSMGAMLAVCFQSSAACLTYQTIEYRLSHALGTCINVMCGDRHITWVAKSGGARATYVCCCSCVWRSHALKSSIPPECLVYCTCHADKEEIPQYHCAVFSCQIWSARFQLQFNQESASLYLIQSIQPKGMTRLSSQ